MLEYAFMTFGSLFAIVDPFAAIPPFLAMFALLGPAIFKLFGITLAAFQVAGGLVLLLSSLDMLRAQKSALKETPEELAEGMSKDDIAITPLAVPLLSGPGAITTSIVLSGRAQGLPQKAIFFALIALVALVSYWTLVLAAESAKKLSPILLNIVTRLMGLLTAPLAAWRQPVTVYFGAAIAKSCMLA